MPLNFLLCLIFSFYGLNHSADEHKFYVSTTTIEFKAESKTLQIISQLFTDDIESIIRQQDDKIRLDPDSDEDAINQLIADYFKQTLVFTSRGKPVEYVFLGKEYKNDIIKCFIELELKEVPSHLELINTLLLSSFEEQQNIVHFKNLGQRKSYLLHQNKQRILLSLEPEQN